MKDGSGFLVSLVARVAGTASRFAAERNERLLASNRRRDPVAPRQRQSCPPPASTAVSAERRSVSRAPECMDLPVAAVGPVASFCRPAVIVGMYNSGRAYRCARRLRRLSRKEIRSCAGVPVWAGLTGSTSRYLL